MPKRTLRMPETMRLVNCAYCRRELLGESMADWANDVRPEYRSLFPQLPAGRIDGRPYCLECHRHETAVRHHRKRKSDAAAR